MACKNIIRSLAVLPIFLLVQCAQDSKTFGEDDLKGFTGTLSGQVLSRKGSPLSSVTVTVSPGGATTTTDGEGRYTLDGISEGAHQVRFMKADYRDTQLGDSVRLGLNDSLEASAAMTYRYATVYGAVVDKNGKPLPTAGVAVQAQSASALAMDEGKFTLARVEPGRVKLFAAQAGVGYGIQEVTLSPEDSLDVSAIKLDRVGGTVGGTVVDGSGLPVSGATVSAVGGVLKDVTGLDGKYELTTVPSESDVQLTVEYGGQKVGVGLVQVGEGGSETLPVISIGSGLGVDLIAMLPSTQLVPSGASSVSVMAQAVWDETDERNTPYWYIWSTDGGESWDSTTTPWYELDAQRFASLKEDAVCETSGRCHFDIQVYAAALDGNQSRSASIGVIFPAADQFSPIPSSDYQSSSSSDEKATSIWDALHSGFGVKGRSSNRLGGSWYAYAGGLNSTVSPLTVNLADSILANGYMKTAMHLDVDATQGWASAGVATTLNGGGTAVDLSAKAGFCLTYRGSHAGLLELYGKVDNVEYHYRAPIPANAQWSSLDLPFSSFSPVNQTSPAISATLLKSTFHSVGVVFVSDGTVKLDREFALLQLGWMGECDTAGSKTVGRPFDASLKLSAPPFVPSTQASLWDIGNGVYGHDTSFGGQKMSWPYNQGRSSFGGAGGFLYSYGDTNSSGTSYVEPRSYDSASHMSPFNDSIAKYGYLHTVLHLKNTIASPYAAVVYPFVEKETFVDLSTKSGVCFTYRSSSALTVRLASWDYDSSKCYYGDCNLYRANLPASAAWRSIDLPFDANTFSQDPTWGTSADFSTVLKSLVTRMDLFYEPKLPSDTIATLDLMQIGWQGECSATAR